MPKATDEKGSAEGQQAPAESTAKAGKGAEKADPSKQKTRARRFPREGATPAAVVQTYFSALDARDLETMVSCWAPGGLERIAPVGELTAPDEVREFFAGLFAAVPDSNFEVLDFVSEGDKVVVRWRNTGTFSGGPFMGFEATGSRIDMEGMDMLTVADGKIVRNDAYYDGTQFARQIGLMPARDSAAERGMARAFNARTRVARRLFSPELERVADGVWLVRGGFPLKTMNVYLIEDDGAVTAFDSGIRAMTNGIATAAAGLGGVKRVVLGHGHADHRGGAAGLGAPVHCHPDEVADTEGDGGAHYFDFSKLDHWWARMLMPRFLKSWDGGPVQVAGTLSEGDEIAGFSVVHLPGHSPGMIGLWRESDRLALSSDTFYTLDPETGRHGPPRMPHRAFNQNTELARASMLKLADMEPAAAWPGHADPVTGDVAGQLRQAASAA